MADDLQLQKLWTQISDLSLETTVLSFILIHLTAAQAKASPDPQQWLSQFAETLLSAVDKAPGAPEDVRAHLEKLRGRIDFHVNAARLRLDK
jgi:hypothetical protein